MRKSERRKFFFPICTSRKNLKCREKSLNVKKKVKIHFRNKMEMSIIQVAGQVGLKASLSR